MVNRLSKKIGLDLIKVRKKKAVLTFFLAVPILFVFIFAMSKYQERENNSIEFHNNHLDLNSFKLWDASHSEKSDSNSFVTISYDKCIPIKQCKFEDCDIEGSKDGNGNYCLPVGFSKIGDWVPDLNIDVLGVSLLKNPSVYSVPVEHTQASARLIDIDNNAYFMFSNSQNYFGFIWIVEVQGIDPEQPQYITAAMPARVVWWQKLNKCRSKVQCNDQYNPGNFNHPARISRVGDLVAIAFQNYSYTLKGKLKLSQVSHIFKDIAIPVPKPLEVSTLPIYPKIRSGDAVAFYDVSNPKKPKFVRKLVGDQAELWGGYPPGRDISEVAIIRAGNYYHMNVGGTIYNYNGQGENKLFGANYRITLPYVSQSIYPLLGDINANVFAKIREKGESYPVSVDLKSLPMYSQNENSQQYGFGLQLVAAQLAYDKSSNYTINESTHSTFVGNKSVLSTNMFNVEIESSNYQDLSGQVLADIHWKSEACERAWGFQVLENGAYNVICHDANPRGETRTDVGRFLVWGVSPENQPNEKHQAL